MLIVIRAIAATNRLAGAGVPLWECNTCLYSGFPLEAFLD